MSPSTNYNSIILLNDVDMVFPRQSASVSQANAIHFVMEYTLLIYFYYYMCYSILIDKKTSVHIHLIDL